MYLVLLLTVTFKYRSVAVEVTEVVVCPVIWTELMERVFKIVAELKSIKSKVEDKVTTIKLSETISVLEKMKMGKSVTDGQVSSIMLSYELIKELKSKLK